jgi:membrane protease subunit HflK
MTGRRSPWGKPPPSGPEGERGTPAPSGEDAPKGPRNPWLPGGGPQERPRRSASIEDIFKNRGPEGPRRTGGPGGPRFRLPDRPGGKSWLPLGMAAIVAIFLFVSIFHQVGPKEQGIVTTFGSYSRTLQPGLNFTLPWPFQNVEVTDVTSIRSEKIPTGTGEKLILTGDQNLVDLSYIVRWNIKDLQLYKYQLAEPDETLREVAEAAMRASVAEQNLDGVLSGAGRAQIEQRVHTRMQAILDAYRSGMLVQGVEIDKTDPPERVVEAFKDVSAAQQDADAELNRAEAYSQQVLSRAQGDAAEFDKIYEEYRMAPEVTQRRLYYETMESVLSKTDKTVVEAEGVTPYLPLPEVNRRRAAQPQAAE